MNSPTSSNIFLLKRSIDLSLLRQGFHIPPEFHSLVYAALGRELHHGESCDVQLMVEGKVFHRIVHRYTPRFNRDALCFDFENGVHEAVRLDRHLRRTT